MSYQKSNDVNDSFQGHAVSGALIITRNNNSTKQMEGQFHFTTNEKGMTGEPVQVLKITEGSFKTS